MRRYNPLEIEPKWQQVWDETGTYVADLGSDKKKYYAMSMFNYPSGAGIHIGHALNYTISDVMARLKRQQGYESYHPVGWDAFGLPAENYAIKTGVSPQQSMAQIIPSYHKQYKAMGWSNDWTKEIATHEPEYYKWTQWIFAQMFKAGLAYQDSRMQWWCDIDKTVLSNEQVIDGKCWRHDGPDDPIVTQREIKQWFFKITEYADEMLAATDGLDWTDSVKLAQKNWIGKSEGMLFTSPVKDTDLTIQTFSAHFEAFTADTFVVIAPDHPFLTTLISGVENEKEILDTASAMVRQRETNNFDIEELEGVFTGRYIVDPVGNGDLPIWVANYALSDYGTGIVKCSAHDERDFRFAKKYNIPLKTVLFPSDSDEAQKVADQIICYSDMQEGILHEPAMFKDKPAGENRRAIIEYLIDNGLAEEKVNYKLRDWSVSRQRYWGAPIPIINCPTDGAVLVADADLPVVLPELVDFAPSGDGRSALATATDWLHVTCPTCGGDAERETDTLDTYICSSWYFLRYLDPRDSDKIFDSTVANKWMPVDFYNGGDHATAHMIYARFVTRFLHKQGLVDNPEPFKRFLFNGKVVASDGSAFSKSKGNGIDPLEIINSGYGADSLRTYLMFASPLEFTSRWDPQGVPGSHRFLNRIWNLVQEFQESKAGEPSDAVLRLVHPTIKKVTEDIENQRYNTAIAAMMKLTNDLYELKAKDAFGDRTNWQFALEALVAMVGPFGPHISEELWHQLGHDTSVHHDSWPHYDQNYLVGDTMTIVVQVNGKLRAQLELAIDQAEDDIKKAALEAENVVKFLDGKQPFKVIYVPKKIVNIVVK